MASIRCDVIAKVNYSDGNKNDLQQLSYNARNCKIENVFGTTFAGESLRFTAAYSMKRD